MSDTHWTEEDLAIANGGTTSAAFVTGDKCRGSVQMPATLTSTGLLFSVSNDNVTFTTVKVAGVALTSITVAANHVVPLPKECFASKFTKAVLGSAEGAARTLKLFLASPAAS